VRWSAAESNWDRAGAKARLFVDAVDAGLDLRQNLSMTTGELTTWLGDHKKGIGVSSGLTIADTIKKFLDHKEKAPRRHTARKITSDSLYRYKFVLDSLSEFCASKGIVLIKDITFSVVDAWSHTWNLDSQAAKRGRQEKIRNFIKFCLSHAVDDKPKSPRILATNPIAEWESFALDKKDDAVSEARIIRPKVLAKIMKAVDDVEMTPENRVRVKACMRLQLEAGLAIVDAVMLHKDELVNAKGKIRIKTARQKTDNPVNNVITPELGKLLLKVKNGNPEYFFWSGDTLPEDAPSYFQKLYRKVFKKAGVEHTSHDFRHTFAAYFLEAGNSTEDLRAALGHGSIDITERYYSHFTGKRQAALDESIERTQAAMGSGD
jgi:integrase